MPIAVKAVSKQEYQEWINSKTNTPEQKTADNSEKETDQKPKEENHQEDPKKGHVIKKYKENL